MISFREKVQEKKKAHAYCEGVKAYRSMDINNRVVLSPYDKLSKADTEWLDGYYDAWHMDIILGDKL